MAELRLRRVHGAHHQQNVGFVSSDACLEEEVEYQQAKSLDSGSYTIRISKPSVNYAVGIVVFAVVFCIFACYRSVFMPYSFPDEYVDGIGVDTIFLFRRFDHDGDGYIDIEEFEPLGHVLKDINLNDAFNYTQEIDELDEILSVEATFGGINMSSLTKDTTSVFAGLDAFKALSKWKEPCVKERVFAAPNFAAFLPPTGQKIGEPWFMVHPPGGEVGRGLMSNNRYYPPRVANNEIIFHRLLSMFHARPFVVTRFGPRGSASVVTAQNNQFLNISFRIHAEFQLNEPPYFPFWFTPAQFTGYIVIDRKGTHVADFVLYLPTHRPLNIDMEWLNGPRESNMEVNIGFVDNMVLKIKEPSKKRQLGNKQDSYAATELKNVLSNPEEVLAKQFYPFLKVPYLNFEAAMEKANLSSKLIHSIVLWGSLDDQSC